MIALAKQKPKSVSIAISPIGTPNHLGAEMLAQYGNIDLIFVPYDGIAKSIPDLMANRVDLAIGAISSLLPLVRSGALKALALASPQRSSLAPDIPTSAEAGLPVCRSMAGFASWPPVVRRHRSWHDWTGNRQNPGIAAGARCLRKARHRGLPHGAARSRRVSRRGGGPL